MRKPEPQEKRSLPGAVAHSSPGLLRLLLWLACVTFATPTYATDPVPNLQIDITHSQIANRHVPLIDIRSAGRQVFSTPFNRADGIGDGPINPNDKISPGGRPALGNNGMFLRMNGLDSQTCLECHGVLSNASVPARFAVGGVGGIGASAFPGVINPDVDDSENNGFAAFQGRMINPPFIFGSGGVELVGKEMTRELQALKAKAIAQPGVVVALVAKGVDYGEIVCAADGSCDSSGIDGIDEDLVVRPFGRKGCCATTRDFDIGAMQFHHGIQPVEVVGEGVDADGDGVANELTVGEMSALAIFQTTMERPRVAKPKGRDKQHARNGKKTFAQIGCDSCHIPELHTQSRRLDLSFPEVHTDPSANVYYSVDLTRHPTSFKRKGRGIRVPLYADLRRHYMGPGLEESTGSELDPWFTTARLWGVADTAPYLHDGRALTLDEAILFHGGEGESARNAYAALPDEKQNELIVFLKTLRTPKKVGEDLAVFDIFNR
jgi:hypothetical protein